MLINIKDPHPHEMNHSHTNEIKGVAILMVLFSHIGYFLFSDHRFLYPLSVAGGVGVNLFLFLSGFGLTTSALKSEKSIPQFYLKRLSAIFIPMWLVLTLTLILDVLLLGKFYNFSTIFKSFLGFFPSADIVTDINSPLWYFSLILFYYLIFPLVFWKKRPTLSAIIILLSSLLILKLKLPVTKDVLKLYQLHYLAFPLGMVFATQKENLFRLIYSLPALYRKTAVRYFLILLTFVLFGYTAIHSGVGEGVRMEQTISLITMLATVAIILLMDVQSRLLILFGTYSYEIYLIQWPLMYRYDFIYKHTSAFLGTLIYLIVFIVLGFALNKLAMVRFFVWKKT